MLTQHQKTIVIEMIPSFIKDLFTVMTPYFLFITELIPAGLAIFSGVLGCLHLWKKYKLTSIQLKNELEKQNQEK